MVASYIRNTESITLVEVCGVFMLIVKILRADLWYARFSYLLLKVIQEIDDMMQEDEASLDDSPRDLFENSEVMEKAKEVLASPLYEDSM